jgi:4-amino-4-deoxy-L-arabinose transferase-like glycosyltransferase
VPGNGRSHAARIWLAAIVAVGALLRVYPVWFGLPYLNARPDESTSIMHAVDVMHGDFNPRFFHWPSLTFYAFGAVFTTVSDVLGALTPGATLTDAQQLVLARACIAFAGTGTILILYHLGRRLADAWTGIAAAALLAVSLLHVRESHFAMTDVLMTLFVTGSLALLVRALDATASGEPAARWFAAAGFAGGLGASTKYSAAVIVTAMVIAQIVWIVRSPRRAREPRFWLPSTVFLAAFATGFLAATPYAVIDSTTFAADLRFDFTHLSGGHIANLGRGWDYHLRRTLPYGVGWPVCVAALPGVVLLLRRHGTAGLAVGGFALVFYASIGSGLAVFFRYALPLVPLVCLFAAVAMRQGAGWLTSPLRLAPGMWMFLLTALLATQPLLSSVQFDLRLARTDTRVLAAEWLRPRLAPEDAVHEAGGLYAAIDLGGAAFHRWTFDPASASFIDAGGRLPEWLVLESSPLWTYASVAPELRSLAARRYSLSYDVSATAGVPGVYDLQDAFFMPVSGFGGVIRPGPSIQIYRLRP